MRTIEIYIVQETTDHDGPLVPIVNDVVNHPAEIVCPGETPETWVQSYVIEPGHEVAKQFDAAPGSVIFYDRTASLAYAPLLSPSRDEIQANLKVILCKLEPGTGGGGTTAWCGLDAGLVQIPFPAWFCKIGTYAWTAGFLYYGNEAMKKPNPFNLAITALAGWNAARAWGIIRK